MNKQMTLSCFCDELAQTKTSKKAFLNQMEQIIPWDEWIGIIKPCYYKGERGNKPYDLELMLRIYILQNLYDLSDMRVMTEVIDSRAFLEFCGVGLVKSSSEWRHYRKVSQHTSEKWHTKKLFSQVVELMFQKGLILKRRTIVDSTIIAAPSSTKIRRKSVTHKRIL